MTHTMALVLAAALAAATGQVGVNTVAPQTVKGVPATFDLGGFRLGMTEEEAQRVLKARGMTVRRSSRTDTFDDRVRKLVNMRGGRRPLRGDSVLDSADIDDGRGGRIMIRMLGWPEGARIRGVTYLPPAGTDPAKWRSLLADKYGMHSKDSGAVDGDGLHARWCGQAACLGEGSVFRLGADVGPLGGQITLAQPDGTSQRVTTLVEQEALRQGKRSAPSL
ncbi:hypothetical protein [Sphingomonas sp. Ant20]|uniref:hypothetical protein n=1 Tax=Sphingomonas sp. Ant20 TaxID=104605 RepID=UPI000FE148C4|nr:hypothetical protein [Sphingomonas sp. Ant20]